MLKHQLSKSRLPSPRPLLFFAFFFLQNKSYCCSKSCHSQLGEQSKAEDKRTMLTPVEVTHAVYTQPGNRQRSKRFRIYKRTNCTKDYPNCRHHCKSHDIIQNEERFLERRTALLNCREVLSFSLADVEHACRLHAHLL